MITYSENTRTGFHILFIRHHGLWFLDCSSWDREEILSAFNQDSTAFRDKRVVTVYSDHDRMIAAARNYLARINTKSFVNLFGMTRRLA